MVVEKWWRRNVKGEILWGEIVAKGEQKEMAKGYNDNHNCHNISMNN